MNLKWQLARGYEGLLKHLPSSTYKVVPLILRRALLDLQWGGYRSKAKLLQSQLCESKSPILLISVPKSGTHLLQTLLAGTPGTVLRRSLTEAAYLSREEQYEEAKKKLSVAKPGEIYPVHLYYSEELVGWLNKFEIKRLFIYRDPRDVLVSNMNYCLYVLKELHPWHAFLSQLESEAECLDLLIEGTETRAAEQSDGRKFIPRVDEFYSPFLGWLSDDQTYSLKFEELVNRSYSKNLRACENVVRGLLDYLEVSTPRLSEEGIHEFIKMGSDPSRSNTYYRGRTRSWVKYFNEEHKAKFERFAGALLSDLGYENHMQLGESH